MAQIGIITREPNSRAVDLDRWRQIVASNPGLRRPTPRRIINPFKGSPAVHTPSDTDAEIIVDDIPAGAICRSLADDHELDVWARDETRQEVERIATDIAAQLGARYVST